MATKLVPLPTGIISSEAKKLVAEVSTSVCGQDRAIRYFASAMERHWAGRRDPKHPDRPIISMVLVGPSGVGKTESVRALANHFLGSPERFTLINCGDFEHGHEVSRLYGSAPGYVGNELEPLLSQAMIDSHFIEWEVENGKYYRDACLMREKALKTLEQDHRDAMNEYFEASSQFLALKEKWEELTKQPEDERSEADQAIVEKLVTEIPGDEAKVTALEERIEKISQIIMMVKAEIAKFKKVEEMKNDERVEGFRRDFFNSDYLKSYNLHPRKDVLSIVLLDEIEKGHPDLHKVLLSILDSGILQMARGGVTRFRNSIVIMTTNLGSDAMNEVMEGNNPYVQSFGTVGFVSRRTESGSGGDKDVDKRIYEIGSDALRAEFSREFVGRIDKIVAFRPLSFEALLEILDKLIREFNDGAMRGTSCKMAIEIKLEDGLKRHMVRESMKRWGEGARMLEKRFREYVDDYLSPLINTGVLEHGDRVFFKLEGNRPKLFKIED